MINVPEINSIVNFIPNNTRTFNVYSSTFYSIYFLDIHMSPESKYLFVYLRSNKWHFFSTRSSMCHVAHYCIMCVTVRFFSFFFFHISVVNVYRNPSRFLKTYDLYFHFFSPPYIKRVLSHYLLDTIRVYYVYSFVVICTLRDTFKKKKKLQRNKIIYYYIQSFFQSSPRMTCTEMLLESKIFRCK